MQSAQNILKQQAVKSFSIKTFTGKIVPNASTPSLLT